MPPWFAYPKFESKFTAWLISIVVMIMPGCATWLPSGEQPKPIEVGLKAPPLSDEAVVIETIVLRLNDEQRLRIDELWNASDQQVLSPELRLDLDRNGMRAAKIIGSLPRVLETWLSETERRAESDPLEKTGLSADVQSVMRQWRCRAGSRKEIPIRDLASDRVTLFYHDDSFKGRELDRPRIYYAMTAIPGRNQTAKITLTPELEHGELQNRFIVRDAALRPVSERERIPFSTLAMPFSMQRGECIIVGPTTERKGVGAEFLHSYTTELRYEPVIMIVRLSQSGVDSVFSQGVAQKR